MASGKKRKRGREAAKPRGSKATGSGDLGSAGERDAARRWAESQQRPIGYTTPGPQLPPSLRDLDPDSDVPVIIAMDGAEPPAGAGELIGTLTKPGRLADGTVIGAGARIYRGLRELTREETGADPRVTSISFGDLAGTDFGEEPGEPVARSSGPAPHEQSRIPGESDVLRESCALQAVLDRTIGGQPGVIDAGKPAPPGESRTAVAGSPAIPPEPGFARHHDAQAGSRIAEELGWPDPARVPPGLRPGGPVIPAKLVPVANKFFGDRGRGAGRPHAVPQPALADLDLPDEILRRLKAIRPGDAAGSGFRAGTGDSAIETFHPRPGPQVVITGDLDSVPDDGEPTLVIEDLDPGDSDAGRLRIGSPAEIRRAREREKAADRQAQALIPAARNLSGLARTRQAAEAVAVRTSWPGDVVMDQHAWLTHHYRNPPDDLADYLAFHIRNAVNQDYRTISMFWPVDLARGADTGEGRQLAQLIARGLGDAESFQVTAPMVAKMRAERETRDAGLAVLDEGWLPCPAGFAWLDAPWLTEVAAGYWLPVRAVSWERTVVTARSDHGAFGLPADGRPVPVDSVRIVLWLLLADDVAFGRWKGAEQRAGKVAGRIGRLVPQQVSLLPFGARITAAGGKLRTNGEQLMGIVSTLWAYLGELLPRSRTVRPSAPATARRVARSLKHSELRIITLREYSYIGDPEPHFPRAVSRTCKWWVEDFYRHIDSYDDGADDQGRRRRHEAIPAGRTGYVTDDDHDICAVCLAGGHAIRISLVHGHRRGPAWLPWKKPARERTLKRLAR